MKSAKERAEEMVPEPDGKLDEWRSCIGDAEDYAPLEVQEDRDLAESLVEDARGIIERLVTSERAAARAPLEALLREVRSEFGNELVRMGQLGELGGPKEANVRGWIAKIQAALTESR